MNAVMGSKIQMIMFFMVPAMAVASSLLYFFSLERKQPTEVKSPHEIYLPLPLQEILPRDLNDIIILTAIYDAYLERKISSGVIIYEAKVSTGQVSVWKCYIYSVMPISEISALMKAKHIKFSKICFAEYRLADDRWLITRAYIDDGFIGTGTPNGKWIEQSETNEDEAELIKRLTKKFY